jgi:hypothetical protein
MRLFAFITWQVYYWLLVIFVIIGGLVAHFNLVDKIDWVLTIVAVFAAGFLSYRKMYKFKNIQLESLLCIVFFHYLYIFYLDNHYGAAPAKSVGDYVFAALLPLPFYVILYFLISGKLRPKFARI